MGDQRNAEVERGRALQRAGNQQQRVYGTVRMPAMVRENFWPGTLMALGVFLFILTFWGAMALVYAPVLVMFRWFAILAFAGNLLPYVHSGLRLGMERLEWFLFNLLAVGPILFSALVWLNFFVHGPVEIYHVGGQLKDPVRYWREHGGLPPMERWKDISDRFNAGELPGLIQFDHVTARARGCLGYDVRTFVTEDDLKGTGD